MALYDIKIICHSVEPRPQLKSFINLDGKNLGVQINEDLRGVRFFIYEGKRKNQVKTSKWFHFNATFSKMCKRMLDMLKEHYKEHDRLVDGELPTYTVIEAKKLVSHLNYHILAKTLHGLLEKEVIYY